MRNNRPFVGVAVIIRKNNRVLLGKRKGTHGAGTWNFPGGHLEYHEELADCAKREVMEETGITVKNINFAALTNDFFEKEKKHYITIFMICDHNKGVPINKEPDKCEGWRWFKWDTLPKPYFLPIVNLQKQKYNPFS